MAFSGLLGNIQAQKSKAPTDEKDIKKTIRQFFEGMEKNDTVLLKSVCMPNLVMQTFMADKSGEMQVYTQNFGDFVAMVAIENEDKYEERIRFTNIQVEESLASVWTPYSFYINGKRNHCGTNSFQLVKLGAAWKIQYILDTRRKKGC